MVCCRGHVIRNRRLNSVAHLVPLRSVQFSTTDFVQFTEPYHGMGFAAEHEVAVQTTNQPGNCSPPPGTYRSGAMISLLLGFKHACY